MKQKIAIGIGALLLPFLGWFIGSNYSLNIANKNDIAKVEPVKKDTVMIKEVIKRDTIVKRDTVLVVPKAKPKPKTPDVVVASYKTDDIDHHEMIDYTAWNYNLKVEAECSNALFNPSVEVAYELTNSSTVYAYKDVILLVSFYDRNNLMGTVTHTINGIIYPRQTLKNNVEIFRPSNISRSELKNVRVSIKEAKDVKFSEEH